MKFELYIPGRLLFTGIPWVFDKFGEIRAKKHAAWFMSHFNPCLASKKKIDKSKLNPT